MEAALFAPRRFEGRPVIKKASPIPTAVPCFALKRSLQSGHVRAPCRRADPLLARLRERRKGDERGAQKPAKPHTLAPALLADAVHAVVPIAVAEERQAMSAEGKTLIQSACAVFKQRDHLVGDRRLEKAV